MLNDNQIKLVSDILDQYHVQKASVFGSAVFNQETPSSDIDLLIEPAKGTTLFKLVSLKQDLERGLSKSVDLVTYNGLSPLIKKQVLKNERVFYEKR